MHKYLPTIGLEIHAELKTRTKMFCDSKNDSEEERPNVNICPICLGHPGTLPVVNKEAVKHVLKVGVAVKGQIADFTEFDRKNYFYPDIPKGYQISQYKYPLVSGGNLAGIALTRIHLEEDTGSSLHGDRTLLDSPARTGHEVRFGTGGRLRGDDKVDYSFVDFNRAGVPLMELVTEPVIHSAKEASDFARELQLMLRYLGVAEANMEKGEMRVEANISVSKPTEISDNPHNHPRSSASLGTKVEVKNLNSFRAVERAILYEVERQTALLESGGEVVQETRGWDENKGSTFSQRKKEDSHDYRYFPDPDIPKFRISEVAEFGAEALKKEMPELPAQKRLRYADDYELKENDIEFFVQNRRFGDFFEKVSAKLKDKKLSAVAGNYLISDLSGLMKDETDENKIENIFKDKITEDFFAELVLMIGGGKVSSRGAKDILKVMFEDGGSPQEIGSKRGLIQQSDESSLKDVAKKVIAQNPKVADDFRAGKVAALQFLVGQGMKETKGSANPGVLRKLIEAELK